MCRAAEEQLHHTMLQIKNETFCFCRNQILLHAVPMVCSACADPDITTEIIHDGVILPDSKQPHLTLEHSGPEVDMSNHLLNYKLWDQHRCPSQKKKLSKKQMILYQVCTPRDTRNLDEPSLSSLFANWDDILAFFFDQVLSVSNLILMYLKQEHLEVQPPPQ